MEVKLKNWNDSLPMIFFLVLVCENGLIRSVGDRIIETGRLLFTIILIIYNVCFCILSLDYSVICALNVNNNDNIQLSNENRRKQRKNIRTTKKFHIICKHM